MKRTGACQVSDVSGGEALTTFAWAACDLDRGEDLAAAIEAAPQTPWADAAIAITRSEPIRAADTLAWLARRTPEAYSRLRTAEALAREGRRDEADAELAKALAFYRQAGATAYIREAGALLQAKRDDPKTVMS